MNCVLQRRKVKKYGKGMLRLKTVLDNITYSEYHVTLPPFRRLRVCSFPFLPIGRLQDYFVNSTHKKKQQTKIK